MPISANFVAISCYKFGKIIFHVIIIEANSKIRKVPPPRNAALEREITPVVASDFFVVFLFVVSRGDFILSLL